MMNSETNQSSFGGKNFGISDDALSSIASNWSMVAPLALSGLWIFRRFPKATIFGLAAVGAYIAYKKDVGGIKKAFEAEDAHLH